MKVSWLILWLLSCCLCTCNDSCLYRAEGLTIEIVTLFWHPTLSRFTKFTILADDVLIVWAMRARCNLRVWRIAFAWLDYITTLVWYTSLCCCWLLASFLDLLACWFIHHNIDLLHSSLILILILIEVSIFLCFCSNIFMIEIEMAAFVETTFKHHLIKSRLLVHLSIKKRWQLVAITPKPDLLVISYVKSVAWSNFTCFPVFYFSSDPLCSFNIIEKSNVHFSGTVIFVMTDVVRGSVVPVNDTGFMQGRVVALLITLWKYHFFAKRHFEWQWHVLSHFVC